MTVVCGDSHTATHGAFGALAVGIGTSEVEHVLATQTLMQSKPKSMRVLYRGELGFGKGAVAPFVAGVHQLDPDRDGVDIGLAGPEAPAGVPRPAALVEAGEVRLRHPSPRRSSLR